MTRRNTNIVPAVLLCIPAFLGAQTTGYSSESAFGTASGRVFWGVEGPSGTVVAQPFTTNVLGLAGMQVSVSAPGGPFERLDQGNGWNGNFAPGDALLWTDVILDGRGPMSFIFNQAINSFGTQVQTQREAPFTATISAFDASNVLLGSFVVGGDSNGDADNSAAFIGISSGAGIRRISLAAAWNALPNNYDFAINDLRINGTTTPEPDSLALVGCGLSFLCVIVRQRGKARPTTRESDAD